MSLPILFDVQTGITYGLLYPVGQNSISKEYLGWEMSFYSNEKGRRRGMAYLRNHHLGLLPLYKFELNLKEVLSKSVLIPYIPQDIRRQEMPRAE